MECNKTIVRCSFLAILQFLKLLAAGIINKLLKNTVLWDGITGMSYIVEKAIKSIVHHLV